MTVRELREKYLAFFVSKGHALFPSGSLIPYDVNGRLDESLLFNGAGMTQFKPYFRGTSQPENKRLTSVQKCVRTGDIDEVGDASHLTFFEMLGNFSFGDYFKAEAIALSWEFITNSEWLGLDPQRCAFTIFEEDDLAMAEWSKWLTPAGIIPEQRVFRLDEHSNFWPAGALSNGPPGPCGPNSEMFYWVAHEPAPTGAYSREDFLRDEGEGKWLEFWNDVFIQYEWRGTLRNPARPSDGYAREEVADLPFLSIDTGMGLERAAVVLGGYRTIYDTDAFQPIILAIEKLTDGVGYRENEETDRAMRIIADHLRTACLCIADGILPSNSGRGYVLRRLIRRAVLKGFRTLGLDRTFLSGLAITVVENLGNQYTELVERQSTIAEILLNEEELFRRTLKEGITRLGAQLEVPSSKLCLSGDEAFKLYDTYGFPLEVTLELASEAGWQVDTDGYEAAMLIAQERSRAGQERTAIYGGTDTDWLQSIPPTIFTGYELLSSEGTVLASMPVGPGIAVTALDSTPFYAASGGQTHDIGELVIDGVPFTVTDVAKKNGVFLHTIEGSAPPIGVKVDGKVDAARRTAIRRNHTATHLLHAALRMVLGSHVSQAGSYVGPDRLRFDFTHGKPVSTDELAQIERIVDEQVLLNTKVVTHVDLPIAEAKARGAMALFGEKYGDKVRMVEISEFSRELCGGTHVGMTGEIGIFRISSESSAASGVRRIEAVTGMVAYDAILEESHRLRDAAGLLKTNPKELLAAIEKQLEQQRELKQQLEKFRRSPLAASTASIQKIGAIELAMESLTEGSPEDAKRVADQLTDGQPGRVALVSLAAGGKVLFAAKVGAVAMEAGAHAGNLLKEVSKLAGGGGGGAAVFATAGGRDPSKVEAAMLAASQILGQQLEVASK